MLETHLTKMANQIARNQALLGDPDLTAQRIADHLKRFWAPSMRTELAGVAARDESGQVSAVVKTALSLLEAGEEQT